MRQWSYSLFWLPASQSTVPPMRMFARRRMISYPHPVYQRMQTERQREAAEFRAQDSQKSQEIRTRADRDGGLWLIDPLDNL